MLKITVADEFTDLNFESYYGEGEIIGCGRCSMMMFIIYKKCSPFFSELTKKKYF